jgi:hypothetical protein
MYYQSSSGSNIFFVEYICSMYAVVLPFFLSGPAIVRETK